REDAARAVSAPCGIRTRITSVLETGALTVELRGLCGTRVVALWTAATSAPRGINSRKAPYTSGQSPLRLSAAVRHPPAVVAHSPAGDTPLRPRDRKESHRPCPKAASPCGKSRSEAAARPTASADRSRSRDVAHRGSVSGGRDCAAPCDSSVATPPLGAVPG